MNSVILAVVLTLKLVLAVIAVAFTVWFFGFRSDDVPAVGKQRYFGASKQVINPDNSPLRALQVEGMIIWVIDEDGRLFRGVGGGVDDGFTVHWFQVEAP